MKQINTYINEKLKLTAKQKYTCQPEDKYELQRIILQRIKNEGNECDLNDIDTSKITDMTGLFDTPKSRYFNGDISMWDVSNVKYMHYMFNYCANFNCDISKWNVKNVKSISNMFYRCKKFKQDLNMWDVSNIEFMSDAFKDCPTQPKWYDKDRWEY